MNLLLLEAAELADDGSVTLRDRRAEHLLRVLAVEPGRTLRCGLVDGPTGAAEVLAAGSDRVRLRCRFDDSTEPAPPCDQLLLAVPRPKVLRRAVEDATALGFARIALIRTWKVDRSHLESRLVKDEGALRPHLLAGLEQGGHTRLPRVERFSAFRPFVEDRLTDWLGATTDAAFLAHPRSQQDLAHLPGPAPEQAFTLALGPERGFTEFELDQLQQRGLRPVRSGTATLRVHGALHLLSGQLQLLRRRGKAPVG